MSQHRTPQDDFSLPDRPFVSLVVPVRNEAAHIDACLEAVCSQTYPAELLEVIVVDGCSADGTRERIEARMEAHPMLRMVDNPALEMVHGLNAGIAQARGAVIGVLSGHSIPAANYVERSVAALRASGAWAVGGKIERLAATPLQRAIARATSSPFGVGDARHNYAATAQWVETAFPGMWPRQVFDRIGLFDPAMVSNEDNEFSYRIWQAGGRVWLDPTIVVGYAPRASLRGLFGQYRLYALGKVSVARRHPLALRWRHLVPPAWVAFLLGGAALGTRMPRLRAAVAASAAAYVGTCVTAAWRIRRDGDSVPLVAAAFITVHLAYGLGFWEGIGRYLTRREIGRRDSPAAAGPRSNAEPPGRGARA